MEPVVIQMPDPEEAPAFALDKRSQVSVLLYHDFTTSPSSNPMKIEIGKFRDQMQALKDNGIEVISMGDLLRWKRGEINIPDPCVVISMDDGWREVYTLAFPVLKEFEYPFTLFLYSKYVDIGGRSLGLDQINAMIDYGAEVGSHAKSHMYLTKRQGLSEEGYREFLVRELQESRDFLHRSFDQGVLDIISYPYGAYSQEIINLAKELGYQAGVTVDGKKTAWNTENMELGRFIIHGNDERNFGYALTFRGNTSLAGSGNLLAPTLNEDGEEQESPVVTWPADKEHIEDRLPLVWVDLSGLQGVDPASLRMTVSGLGWVPAAYDASTGKVSYQVQQRLRERECTVYLNLRRQGEAKNEFVAWKFYLGKIAHYVPVPAPVATEDPEPREQPVTLDIIKESAAVAAPARPGS